MGVTVGPVQPLTGRPKLWVRLLIVLIIGGFGTYLFSRGRLLEDGHVRVYLWTLIAYIFAERFAYRGDEAGATPAYMWTRILLGVLWIALIFAPVIEYSLFRRTNDTVIAVGFALTAAGVGVRVWGIRTLGKFFSGHVASWTDHTIVNTGPYRVIRHPAYAGNILMTVGLPLLLNAYLSLFVSAALIGAFVTRLVLEERFLARTLSGYTDYMKRTKRIVPWVW